MQHVVLIYLLQIVCNLGTCMWFKLSWTAQACGNIHADPRRNAMLAVLLMINLKLLQASNVVLVGNFHMPQTSQPCSNLS